VNQPIQPLNHTYLVILSYPHSARARPDFPKISRANLVTFGARYIRADWPLCCPRPVLLIVNTGCVTRRHFDSLILTSPARRGVGGFEDSRGSRRVRHQRLSSPHPHPLYNKILAGSLTFHMDPTGQLRGSGPPWPATPLPVHQPNMHIVCCRLGCSDEELKWRPWRYSQQPNWSHDLSVYCCPAQISASWLVRIFEILNQIE